MLIKKIQLKKILLLFIILSLFSGLFSSCGEEKVYTILIPPFYNQSPQQKKKTDSNQPDFLALGLADEIIRRLNASSKINTISLEELMAKVKYQQQVGNENQAKEYLKIASNWNTDYVLLGYYTFRPEENIISFSAKVYQAKDSKIVAVANVSGGQSEWNAKRKELILTLAKKIGIDLTDAEKKNLAQKFTDSFDSFMQNYIGLAYYFQAQEAKLKKIQGKVQYYSQLAAYYFTEALKKNQQYEIAAMYLAQNNVYPSTAIPTPEKVQGLFSLMTVFGYNSNQVKTNIQLWFQQNQGASHIVQLINSLPSGFYLEIQGHNHSEEDNVSMQRAKYIYDQLVARGAEPSRLNFKGYGNDRYYPWTQKSDLTNSRVDFVVKSGN